MLEALKQLATSCASFLEKNGRNNWKKNMELAVWTLALFKVLPNQDEVHWGWCLKRAILCFFPTLYSFLAARYFSGCSNFCTAQAVGSDPFDIQAGHGIFLAPEISVKILCPELPWNFPKKSEALPSQHHFAILHGSPGFRGDFFFNPSM